MFLILATIWKLPDAVSNATIFNMGKSTSTLLDRELQAMVRSGIFSTKAEAVQEALGTFFAARPQYRIEAALEMFRSGEVTLSRAAEIAGLNSCRFREIWRHRGGRHEMDSTDAEAQAKRIARRRS